MVLSLPFVFSFVMSLNCLFYIRFVRRTIAPTLRDKHFSELLFERLPSHDEVDFHLFCHLSVCLFLCLRTNGAGAARLEPRAVQWTQGYKQLTRACALRVLSFVIFYYSPLQRGNDASRKN